MYKQVLQHFMVLKIYVGCQHCAKMAEKLLPDTPGNEDSGSSEIFSCELCFNEGVDEDAVAFCLQCRTHLCKHCVNKHQRKWKSHNVIDEFGYASISNEKQSGEEETIRPDIVKEKRCVHQQKKGYDTVSNTHLKVDSNTYVIRRHEQLTPVTGGIQEGMGQSEEEVISKDNVISEDDTLNIGKLPTVMEMPPNGLDSFVWVSEVNVHVHNEFCVSSMTMLTREMIVMVEESRQNVLVLDSNPDILKHKSVINFEEKPAYVARVRHNEFVVTFPNEHEVRFVKFVSQTFNVGEAINVHDECAGICMIGETGNMLIAYPLLRELKILTITGQIVKTMSTISTHVEVRPLTPVVYGECIYLVNQLKNCVLKCFFVGEKLKVLKTTYLGKGLRRMPTDITVSSDGDLFVSVAFDDVIYRLSGKTMEIKNKYGKEQDLHRPGCISSLCGDLAVFEHHIEFGYLKVKIYKI